MRRAAAHAFNEIFTLLNYFIERGWLPAMSGLSRRTGNIRACCALSHLSDTDSLRADPPGIKLMRVVKTVGIVMCSSLLLMSAAFASSASGAGARNADHAKANHGKSDHNAQKTSPAAQKTPAPASRNIKPQAPIVMGRSISIHRKSKLHHVTAAPADASEAENQL